MQTHVTQAHVYEVFNFVLQQLGPRKHDTDTGENILLYRDDWPGAKSTKT